MFVLLRIETSAKPSVLGWAKPNNTKHNSTEAGFWVWVIKPKPKAKNPHLLVMLTYKQGSSFLLLLS